MCVISKWSNFLSFNLNFLGWFVLCIISFNSLFNEMIYIVELKMQTEIMIEQMEDLRRKVITVVNICARARVRHYYKYE